MHKVDAPGASGSNEFVDRDIGGGIAGTDLAAKWHNTMQRELVAAVEASGQTLDDSNDAQLLEAIGRLAGSTWNQIVNPDFSIIDRVGTAAPYTISPSNVGEYFADRWMALGVTGSVDFFLGNVLVPDISTVGASSRGLFTLDLPTDTVEIGQAIEDVSRFPDGSYVVSFWAKRTNAAEIRVSVRQNYGVGNGHFDALSSQVVALSDSWTRHTVAVTLGDYTGSSLDDLTSNLAITLEIANNSGGSTNVELTGIQFNSGTFAPEFVVRPPALERALAARYFQTSGLAGLTGYVHAGDTGPTLSNLCKSLSPMRTDPDITWYADASGEVYIDGVSTPVDYGGGATDAPTPISTGAPRRTDLVANAYAKLYARFTADADYEQADFES